jgi:hypothetical protein
MSDDNAIEEILIAGIYDWVMLDEVTWEVMHGDLSGENRERTLRVLGRLFREGLMVPGDLHPSGFGDWQGSAAAWLVLSGEELERRGWKPMGAGFYLRLTEFRGRVAAEEARSRR